MHTCISPEGPFSTLPKELYFSISDYLETPDLSAFSRTNTIAYTLLNTTLYKRDACSSNPISLFWAAIHNNPSTALKSIAAGCDVTAKTDIDTRLRGCTPILLASFHNSIAVLKILLLDDNVTPNFRDRKWIRPPLSWAVKEGHAEVVQALLNDDRTDVNLQDKAGDTALMIAINSRPRMIELLLCSGRADPRVANRQGWTPLSRAARNIDADVGLLLARHLRLILDGDDIEYLIKYFGEKLDPNAGGQQFGRGAFSIAAANGRVDVVKALLKWDVTEPNLQTHWKRQTPLFAAAEDGREDIVELLIGCERVGLDIPDMHGTTPLGVAADKNHVGVVRRLLGASRPVDPNARDENGQTPLLTAAFYGYLGVVEQLLYADGIDLHLKNGDGETPIEVALQNGNSSVVQALRKHLANES
ncbi:unnamed protein product [Penicillium bialowiezense]